MLFSYLLMSGVTTGALYALVALGFVVVNKATGVINFAQGEFFMFTGFIAWMLHVQFGMNYRLTSAGRRLRLPARLPDGPHRLPSDRQVRRREPGAGHRRDRVRAQRLRSPDLGRQGRLSLFPPITSPDPIMVGNVMVIPSSLR